MSTIFLSPPTVWISLTALPKVGETEIYGWKRIAGRDSKRIVQHLCAPLLPLGLALLPSHLRGLLQSAWHVVTYSVVILKVVSEMLLNPGEYVAIR